MTAHATSQVSNEHMLLISTFREAAVCSSPLSLLGLRSLSSRLSMDGDR